MRMYYIFSIKDSIRKLYQKNPSGLYKILESIYFMREDEIDYGYHLFQQIVEKSDITSINNILYIKLHKDVTYSKINNEHIINDLYHDEVSILKVKPTRMVLESNKSFSSFFKILNNINQYYFVCDFKEKDFFFLQNLHYLVKK